MPGLPLLAGMLLWSVGTTCLQADDTVVIGEVGGKTSRVSGTIIDFTGRELTLKSASGRESRIPSGRIREVQTRWPPALTKAQEDFKKHAYKEATAEYLAAYKSESREWVKRRILAQLTWCYRYTKKWRLSASAFLLMLKSDPSSQAFNAIPLAWRTQQAGVDMETTAQGWLEEEAPVARLIAASWLMPTQQRAAALATLQELTQNKDLRIAQLAEAQQWRAKVVTVTSKDLKHWRSVVRNIPANLRAGPYFVLGQASSRLELKEEAILAYLRMPINYPQYRHLAGEAFLLAGREYVRMGEQDSAIRLYREALQYDDDGSLRPVVDARLEQLNSAAAEK